MNTMKDGRRKMNTKQAVLEHLRLTAAEFASINEKRQQQLFSKALKELRRKQRKQEHKKATGEQA